MLVLLKGAGDLGSAAARRLHLMGFRVVMTELPEPLCIRRKVAFAECVFTGATQVEGVIGELATSPAQIDAILRRGAVAVIVDPECSVARTLQPKVIVDARMLRRSINTRIDEADVVIGLGPGFVVGEHAHAVVETNRGHHLGRVLYEGSAEPSTGIPAPIGDQTDARVLRAPASGRFEPVRDIGDRVEQGEVVASVSGQPIVAALSGVIRGLIHEGVHVRAGIKVGDIDPRGVREYCFTISDKANAVAGGVVEACFYMLRRLNLYHPTV